MMKFRKEKMIARLEKEGRLQDIPEEVLKIMNNLDGQEADPNCWARRVYGHPVLWTIGKDGQGYEVNEADCE